MKLGRIVVSVLAVGVLHFAGTGGLGATKSWAGDVLPVCGDAITDEGETCDDGNTNSDDGCNDKCTVESCWSCAPGESGSVCSTVEDGTECNDGSFCNGYDSCLAGSCSEHGGDPCSEGGECASTCDEKKQACENSYGDSCTDDGNPCTDDICDGKGGCGVANEASCDDGEFCNGADVCSEGACTHAGDPCPGTVCNTCQEDLDSCYDVGGTACTSDDNVCTDDMCDGAGACAHPPIPLAPVCRWTVVGGSDTVEGKVRTRVDSQIMGGGGICGDTGDVGDNSQLLDQATWAMLGTSGNVLTVRPFAVVTDGSVVTGGGCIVNKENADIFGSGEYGPICCADGDVALPGGNPANVINACGLHPMIDDCTDAKAQIPLDISLLNGLGQTRPPVGDVIVPKGGGLSITATAGLNVIDVNRVRINRNGVLTITGGASDVVILRIDNGLRSSLRGSVVLAGGLTADNVLFYAADGNCIVNEGGEGAGTLFCPSGTVRLRNHTHWVGAIAGGTSTDIGWDVDVEHVPFLGLAQ